MPIEDDNSGLLFHLEGVTELLIEGIVRELFNKLLLFVILFIDEDEVLELGKYLELIVDCCLDGNRVSNDKPESVSLGISLSITRPSLVLFRRRLYRTEKKLNRKKLTEKKHKLFK